MNLTVRILKFVIACSLAVTAQADKLNALDSFVKQARVLSATPGLAVSIVRGDEVILARGFGVLEAGKDTPVNEDTLFAIGSNTKYFTATALGMLAEEHLLDLDKPLTGYLPQLRFSDPYLFTELTIRDALSHRSGLQRADLAWYANPGNTRAEALSMIRNLSLKRSFRSGFLYNNYLFLAAGLTIPAVTGQSWDAIISERLFEPLQMSRSNTSVRKLDEVGNVAIPHSIVGGKALSVPYYNLDQIAPAGSINSTAADMARWCKVQINGGKFNDRQIIPANVINEVRKPHTLIPLAGEGRAGTIHRAYGLGILRQNYGPKQVAYQHNGGIDGMLSSFSFLPDAKLCVVVLTNSSPNYELNSTISNWILDHMLGLDDKDYLAEFSENLHQQKDSEAKTLQAHLDSHNPSLKCPTPLEGFVNTYINDVYGDLIISLAGSTLQFAYGSLYQGSLTHHQNNSFDLVYEQASRNYSDAGVLSFAQNAKGRVESVLLQFWAEGMPQIRFIAEPAPAENAE